MDWATKYPGLTAQLKAGYDRYVDCTLNGVPQLEAALRSGVPMEHAAEWSRNAEMDRYVRDQFSERLKEVRNASFWSSELASIRLKQIIENPMLKESVRLNALKELNILRGITFTDDKGNSRVANGHSLDYFNELQADHKARAH